MRTAAIAAYGLIALSSTSYAQDQVADEHAWTLAATYTGEVWRAEHGGSDLHYLDNVDLTLDVDGERLFGVRGLELFVYGLYNNGHVLNDAVAGSVQGISNIEATDAVRLYEAWAQMQLGAALSLRGGLYDLNSEFDAIDAAGLFMNPSHGIGPDFAQSGLNGPSIFPATSLALRAQVELDRWQVRVGVFDAVPGDVERPNRTAVRWDSDEGLLYVGEVNYRLANDARTGFGYWQYSARFDDQLRTHEDGSPVTRSNNRGTYMFAETAAKALGAHGELRAFTRTGWANEDVNPVARYIGAGVTWSGFYRSDRDDQLGIAIAHAIMSDVWRDAQSQAGIGTRASESILELTARLPIGESFALQPDLQYVYHPGADASADSCWVFGLRWEAGIAFSR